MACFLKCSKLDFVDEVVFLDATAVVATPSPERRPPLPPPTPPTGSGSGLPSAGDISRGRPPREVVGVAIGAGFWGWEEVRVERMEAAEGFLNEDCCCLVLVGGAGGGATTAWGPGWEWLGGAVLPMTSAAVVATGSEVTVRRVDPPLAGYRITVS